jgi:hypothetical protein
MNRFSLRVVCLAQLPVVAGCATIQMNDQWLEHSARENQRTADVWRSSGGPAQAASFEQQAERDRQAAKKNPSSLLEAILDGLIIDWVDKPQKVGHK